MGANSNLPGQHSVEAYKHRGSFAKIKAKKNKLTRMCQKAWNMSGGPQDRRAGEKRVQGIMSYAPTGHEARTSYSECWSRN